MNNNKATPLIRENFMDSVLTWFERKYDPDTGLEIYDFETADKSNKPWPAVVRTYDGWTILINSMTLSGGIYKEYSPANKFQMVQKEFYPNGMLKQKSYFFQTNLEIGLWEYYDEKGCLIKKVDKDEKFKKSNVKLDDILNLLEKEGWIDRKIGKGATGIIVNENCVIIKPGFNIMFSIGQDQKPVWYAAVSKSEILSISYKIDSETGEVTKEEVPIFDYE